LKIAAKVDKADLEYFESMRHLLDHPLIEFVGEISEQEKNDFIGNAAALIFPIDWPEPFGLVMIEAMACGTPVIARRCGSVPEILEEGVTGFIVNDVEEAVQAVRKLPAIDRQLCRKAFEGRFTSARMAEDYVKIYKDYTNQQEGWSLLGVQNP
jgi:glycosyltransferase involved in cell wall biosynthesis